MTARLLGDSKEDLIRCLLHIAAELRAGEESGDSDDDTSDITWSLEEEEDEDDEDQPITWGVEDAATGEDIETGLSEGKARELYVRLDMDKRAVVLFSEQGESREREDWNCDLDTGRYDDGSDHEE